jgi:hypothetical protein
MSVLRAAYTGVAFDASRLAAETLMAGNAGWEMHFNSADYEGAWSGVALRTNSPHKLSLYIDRSGASFRDTEVLASLPYFQECIHARPFSIRAVRILKLAAGAAIHEHRDSGLSIEHDEARFHVPIVSNDRTEFVVGDAPIFLTLGECWYVNVDLPHRITNSGTTDRIHLVVDAVVTPELRKTIRNAARYY